MSRAPSVAPPTYASYASDWPSGIMRTDGSIARGTLLPGGLQVERTIGRGAVGVVLSVTEEATGRRYAVKMLSAESALEPEQRGRLRREAQAVSRLTSEHVAQLFDVRELDDGTPFLVMEYLEGCGLDDVIAQSGPLPANAAVGYILEALDALSEAHALGLVHRDVKPSNMFLTRSRTGRPAVKLLDFGLVKDAIASPGTLRLTRTGFMLGTPAYMAPEQLGPRAAPPDPRVDVWAIGISLFELLTGHLPFEAPSIPRMVARMLGEPPPLLRPVRPDVTPRLERIILRCLEREPGRRFASAGALAVALGAELF
jgi:serine/threonine protein kinase